LIKRRQFSLFFDKEGKRIGVDDIARDPSHVRDSQGRTLVLGKKIGVGGEGDVYELLSTNRVVVKIFHKPLDAETLKKFNIFVLDHDEDLIRISAWPVSLIHRAGSGEICGYLMPKVSEYVPIHRVYPPSRLKQVFPNADWKFLVRAAHNLAVAFSAISKHGYIMEDPNEGNIFINRQACVKLLDCSSFGVRVQKRGLFYCTIGIDRLIFSCASLFVLLMSNVFPVNACFKLFRLVNKILY